MTRISAVAQPAGTALDRAFESMYDDGAQNGPATRKRPGPWPTPDWGASEVSEAYRMGATQYCEADDDLWMARFLRLANKHGRYQDLPAYLWLNLVVEYCEHGEQPWGEYCYDTPDLAAWLDRMVAAGRIRRERGPETSCYGNTPTRMLQVENWGTLRPKRAHISQRVRAEVLRRCEYRCVHCGIEHGLTMDHIFPWSKGGSDEPDNLQALCRQCNMAKRDHV